MRTAIRVLLLALSAQAGIANSQFFGPPSQPEPAAPGFRQVFDRNASLNASSGGLSDGQYISGTNVNLGSVGGLAVRPLPHDAYEEGWQYCRILTYELKIGGQTIANPETLPDTDIYGHSVRFYSNHFAHNTEQSVVLKVVFRLTGYYGTIKDVTVETPPIDVTVWNYAACFGLPEFEGSENENHHGVPFVSAHLQAMNHSVQEETGNWTKSIALDAIRQCSVFYYNGHGGTYPEIECPPDNEGIDTIDWSEVYDALTEEPPPHAPINLAYIGACLTAGVTNMTDPNCPIDPGDTSLNHGFSTGSFLHQSQSGPCIDRAQVGWRVDTFPSFAKIVDSTYFECLAAGDTAHEARDAAIQALKDSNLIYQVGLNDEVEDAYMAAQAEDLMVVFGDFYMRLWRVYSGNDTHKPDWYSVRH